MATKLKIEKSGDEIDWLSSCRGEDFLKFSSLIFSIFSFVAILVGSRDHRTQFWKGAIQGMSETTCSIRTKF
jgi:hypothetical protein